VGVNVGSAVGVADGIGVGSSVAVAVGTGVGVGKLTVGDGVGVGMRLGWSTDTRLHTMLRATMALRAYSIIL
jgi:hypothetical protein